MSIYSVRELSHSYGERTVLDVPTLDVHAGEVLGIVGPSGAGKSTLLRLLNFLETPSAGVLTFLGEPVGPEPSLGTRRLVTTVFQRPVLLNRTVRENLVFGLKLQGRTVDDAEVANWLERLGLTDLADSPARKLSGGEAQRVALARALLLEPKVLLLDEPTSNLDPYNVGLIERIVGEVREAHQTTVVLVTHNVHQARRLADRTALLISGRLVEVSPTEAFFANPEKEETAAFLRGDLVY
jgi:tungstate transport system ATP-binding protein